MSNQDQDFWIRETVAMLALASMNGVGYWTLFKLSLSGSTFSQIIKTPSLDEFIEYFNKAECKVPKVISQEWTEFQKKIWGQGNELYRRLKKEEIKVIHFGEETFPKSLRKIPEPPRWLFVQGDPSILHQSSIAIVGTREPSEDGEFLARYVGACIPYFDTVTVSGLANGIDQIVHQQSIRFQTPTVAVLGNGIFLDFPAGSESLRYDIRVNGGAVVTEYLPYQGYSGETFVRRNRLQAGLADVLIPVEWKTHSGTAHTVRYANEAKKPIVCLKMPDWLEESHKELALARELGGEVFTIPGEGDNFLNAVCAHLSNKQTNAVRDGGEIKNRHKVKVPSHKRTSTTTESVRQLTLWSNETTNISDGTE